jgi:hypothetical protein
MYLQSQRKNAQFQPIAVMQDKTVAVALPNYARKSIRDNRNIAVCTEDCKATLDEWDRGMRCNTFLSCLIPLSVVTLEKHPQFC